MQLVGHDKKEEGEPFYQEVILWQSRYEGRFDSLKKIETLSRPPVGETWPSISISVDCALQRMHLTVGTGYGAHFGKSPGFSCSTVSHNTGLTRDPGSLISVPAFLGQCAIISVMTPKCQVSVAVVFHKVASLLREYDVAMAACYG